MDTPPDWPFDDPPNLAVITIRPILDGSAWIAFVSHDEDDGGWQFHGPDKSDASEAMVVALHRVFEKDNSIGALADLPLGWQAWRDSPQAPWQRARL
jgi:hypothetical protein